MAPQVAKSVHYKDESPPTKFSKTDTMQDLENWTKQAHWEDKLPPPVVKGKRKHSASLMPCLKAEMRKWLVGKAMAIEKVGQLELNESDLYLRGSNESYERLWDEFDALLKDKDRKLKSVMLLYKEVKTACVAGENEYEHRYPHKGILDKSPERRAYRFMLVKRWHVLLDRVRVIVPPGMDPDSFHL
jgi:hypothetical protein